jgi:hypothetical protein
LAELELVILLLELLFFMQAVAEVLQIAATV